MTEEFEQIEQWTGAVMAAIWQIQDDDLFAQKMSHLTWTVWGHLRDDPYPPAERMRDFADHLTGVAPGDGAEFIKRVLTYGERRMN
ncbi:hypothetical protein [Falsiruegeria mediterranea]